MMPNDQGEESRAVPTLAAAIESRIASGELKPDPAQSEAIETLDGLLAFQRKTRLANKKSALGWLFGPKREAGETEARGAYLWGGVGRGKSMLMDSFFALSPVARKRRVHFHEFMQDVHARIHAFRQAERKKNNDDPVPPIAAELAGEARLLCFDEFAVTDVADAMILARLFTGLFEQGVTVVATSNVAPDDLYAHGLNRSWFLPFIDLVKTRMKIVHLASETDHRMARLSAADLYFSGQDSAAGFERVWRDMTGEQPVEPAVITRQGRDMRFETASGGMLRASFAELCERPLGSGDYLALTDRFHSFFLEDIPRMSASDRNAAKRFIALIDTLYDRQCLLVAKAETRPAGLYPVDHGTEAFEFRRTISRLQEMQAQEWRDTANAARARS